MSILDNIKQGFKRVQVIFGKREFGKKDAQGRWQGPYEEYYPNGLLRTKCTYKDGMLDGLYETYYNSGGIDIRCTYKTAGKDGLFEKYYENGQLAEKCTYRVGNLEGAFVEYYENGILKKESQYHAGVQEGICNEYYENGQLKEQRTYNRYGNADGPLIKYYPNGQISIKDEHFYENRGPEGIVETYHENGQLRSRTRYKNGKAVDGLYEDYHDNGQVRVRCTRKNGERNGPIEVYDKNGVLRSKSYYEDGLCDGPSEIYGDDGKTVLKRTVFRQGQELYDNEADMYLSSWKKRHTEEESEKKDAERRAQVVQNLKDQLAEAADPTRHKPIGRANTPERQAEAEKLRAARRQSDVFNRVTQEVLSAGDEKLLAKMAATIDKTKLNAMYREAYDKLSPEDRKLCSEIGKATGKKMDEIKQILTKKRTAIRARRKSGQR